MLEIPILAISIPFIAGAIVYLIPGRWKMVHEAIAIIVSAGVFVLTVLSFKKIPYIWSLGQSSLIRVDALSGFVAVFIGLFATAIAIYSISFMKGKSNAVQYYAYLLWTLGGSIGAAFSNNLILLLCFWGFLGLTLYVLISIGGADSAPAAKKTFIIVGGSDAAMLLGIAILWHLTGTFDMDAIRLDLNMGAIAKISFLCLVIGAFAKAGAIPLHTWIPDSSEVAPASIMAYLPASLDKLLGIYLLARLTLEIFVITPLSGMSSMLLIIGSVTIIAAVMMALLQHNLKRLLAYHAVSQVGYMVLGIGTANPIGIAGGLFHMVNHAIYKSCLFLSAGSVEKEVKTTELDKLGGLGIVMPITFVTTLIAALAISGVPPFNGFFSKWMVYQGLLELGKGGAKSWILWLAVAMFGSALTLASFMKLIYTAFLAPASRKNVKEAPLPMWLPQVILAILCVGFGVFAYSIPIRIFIAPVLKGISPLSYPGLWNAPLAVALLLAGLFLGFLLFMFGRSHRARRTELFIGGETLPDDPGIKGTSFYDTVKDLPVIGRLYGLAQKKVFDIYEEGARGIFFLSGILQWLHNGILPTYMVWCLIGMLALFFTLVR